LGRKARNRADQIRKEHPLELLAVIAGIALTVGVVTRVRRSRHHG
jgi:hypothetical protein